MESLQPLDNGARHAKLIEVHPSNIVCNILLAKIFNSRFFVGMYHGQHVATQPCPAAAINVTTAAAKLRNVAVAGASSPVPSADEASVVMLPSCCGAASWTCRDPRCSLPPREKEAISSSRGWEKEEEGVARRRDPRVRQVIPSLCLPRGGRGWRSPPFPSLAPKVDASVVAGH